MELISLKHFALSLWCSNFSLGESLPCDIQKRLRSRECWVINSGFIVFTLIDK